METIRQTLEWQVGEDRYALAGGPDRWALTTPDTTVDLSTPALAALAEAIARLGLAAPPAARDQRSRHARAGKPWTDEEDAELEQQHQAGLSRREMAREHGRSIGAITARLVHLGLEEPTGLPPLPSARRFRGAADG